MEIESNTNQTKIWPKADRQPNWAVIGFIILGIVTAFGVGWLLLGPLSIDTPNSEDLKIKNIEDLRNYFWSLGMVVAGVVAIWGLAFAAVRTVALDRQAKVAETDSKFSEKKHQSEAFATAIEQLGHDNYAVRMGAVYALEALAKSSKGLHGPIFETLCAYVRKEAPAPESDDLIKKLSDLEGENEARLTEWDIFELVDLVPRLDVVIQAILTVIGRRNVSFDPEGFRLDLRNTDLRKADLRGCHLENAILERSNLIAANMSDALLDNASLKLARMVRTHLENAQILSADLSFSNLDFAICAGARIDFSDLTLTSLRYANLSSASLQNCHMNLASFNSKTNVTNATFKGAKHLPRFPTKDIRNTLKGSDSAIWPSDDDKDAWDDREIK